MLLQQMSACADNSGSLALLRLKITRGGELILIDLLKITLLHIYIYIYIYIYISLLSLLLLWLLLFYTRSQYNYSNNYLIIHYSFKDYLLTEQWKFLIIITIIIIIII